MKIQSLSVVVPNKACINNCKFCVSKMTSTQYENRLDAGSPYCDLYLKDYISRLEFARDNGCNTVILTGTSEPQQNKHFLMLFGLINKMLSSPFKRIEMQTTGALLDRDYLRFLRNHVGVTTISLSISSFVDEENTSIIGAPCFISLKQLCEDIKDYGFNLRLSLNMNKALDLGEPSYIFERAKSQFLADQITFRVLYQSREGNTPQDAWIRECNISDNFMLRLRDYILRTGTPLERLEFGAMRYAVDGLSTVIDDDCMSVEAKEELKYLILREDCRLYTKWDKKDSLLF